MLDRGGFGFGADFVKNGGPAFALGLHPDLDERVRRKGQFDLGQHGAGQALVADQHYGNEFVGKRLLGTPLRWGQFIHGDTLSQ